MIELRIFRQPTKDIQPDGQFYIDVFQFNQPISQGEYNEFGYVERGRIDNWIDVPIVEADSY